MSKTPEEEQSLAYLNYPTRPRRINMAEALDTGKITMAGDNWMYQLDEADQELFGEKKVEISPYQRFSSVEGVMFGLNETVIRNEQNPDSKKIRELLETEMEKYKDLQSLGKESLYGTWFYYPTSRNLVQCAPEALHRLALVISHIDLYNNLQGSLTPLEVQQVLKSTTVAVAGGSVGSNIARLVAMELCPDNQKLSDGKLFKIPNLNRTLGGYDDIVWSSGMIGSAFAPSELKNKAQAYAEQVHKRNPYTNVWAYSDFIDADNIGTFIGGSQVEPRADFFIEEVDDLDVKILSREVCRRERVRHIMATDRGSVVQVDIRPFDIDPNASLVYAVADFDLYSARDKSKSEPSKESAMAVIDAMIGDEYRKHDEFGRVMRGEIQGIVGSFQQTGSTAMLAAGIVTEVIARTTLGHKYPERFSINKRTLEVKADGELV